MKQVQATVTKNESVSEICHHSRGRVLLNSQLIWLNCPQIASEAHPGQFVMVRCGQECTLPRPFSIHQVNDAGDIANLLGPLGNDYSIQPGSHNLLLLAGGVGIAPLYFLAQEALRRECSVTLLYGTANENRLSCPFAPRFHLQ